MTAGASGARSPALHCSVSAGLRPGTAKNPLVSRQVARREAAENHFPQGRELYCRGPDRGYCDVFVSGGEIVVGTTRLYGGDVNSDNNINILDIVTIIGSLGTVGVPIRSICPPPLGGYPGWPPPSPIPAPPPLPLDSALDINDDGVVNISDLAITSGNFGKTGPTNWAP